MWVTILAVKMEVVIFVQINPLLKKHCQSHSLRIICNFNADVFHFCLNERICTRIHIIHIVLIFALCNKKLRL